MLIESLLPAARRHLAVIGDDALVIDAAKLLGRPHINLVAVCNPDDMMVGVLSRNDIVRHISQCRGAACTMSVAGLMTRDVVACRPGDLLDDVWSVMKDRGFRHVPIIDDDSKPLGIIYARDALDSLLTEVKDAQRLLLDYVACAGYH
jgi:CBS domain-containing protein